MTSLAKVNLTSSDGLTAQAGLGDEYQIGGCRFKYVRCNASAAVTTNTLCLISAANLITMATTALVGTAARPTGLCVPQFAMAVDEYAWVPIGPWGIATPYNDPTTGAPVTFKVQAANTATSVRVYTTATSGVVDDAVTTGNVAGLYLTETVTTQEAADCVACQRLVSFCEL